MNDYGCYSAASIGVAKATFTAEVDAKSDRPKENSVQSAEELIEIKSEYNLESYNIPPDPLEDPLALKTEETDIKNVQLCDADNPATDIELQNVLELEHVLRSMHGTDAASGSAEGGDRAFPLDNELERVMQLENVLRKVNGNLSEFKVVEEALRKIHETVTLDGGDNDNDTASSETNHGVKQLSDIEVALQNDPLILTDDFRESFSTIEEWASSQLKQQEISSTLPKDGSSFSLKSEGEVMKSAKILFAKKTKTLFRWLHPKDTKADLRQRVDRAWDSLSANEIEFYYSQVLGPFNHRQVKPMINPRIFELLNIPEPLRVAPGKSAGADVDTEVADFSHQQTSDEPKNGKVVRSRRTPKPKVPSVGIPRRKRGPYKKTLQARENSSAKEKRKRDSSSSSSSDREYFPSSSTKRGRGTKKKKITKMGKLRLKFCKMKTTKLPASSDSDDYEGEECDSDFANPYKRRFGGTALPQDNEISAELTQGLEECDKLLDSDCSM